MDLAADCAATRLAEITLDLRDHLNGPPCELDRFAHPERPQPVSLGHRREHPLYCIRRGIVEQRIAVIVSKRASSFDFNRDLLRAGIGSRKCVGQPVHRPAANRDRRATQAFHENSRRQWHE